MRQPLRGVAPVVAVLFAAGALAAGCGRSSQLPTDAASSQAPASSAASPAVTGSLPAATPAVALTDSPAPATGSPTTSDSPAGSPPSGGAAACSGSSENRDFFATVAGLVTWDVYCAVVPDGWYIDSGRWRLKDGGRLDVTYQGPNGARIVVAEGAFCTDGASACAPMDQHLGTAAFGDRQGNLGSLGGNLVLYVDAGAQPAWQVTGTGLDQQTFVSLAAAFTRVGR